MRGRGLAFLAGRAAGKNRAYEEQAMQQQATPQQSSQSSQTDQLEKLSQMHDSGELSDEEFSQAKKQVLSGK